ncbi:MAG: hypothetical protein EBR88_07160 [Betaproteobacteria bacterium]|nr:hypothetical protein [Betaproteobacteria bacterium]
MATPFIAIADAARIARTAAQNLGARDSGAMSTVKLAAGHFDARLAADPLGSLSAQEVDTAFAQIRRRAEATGNVDEILAVEALRDEMVRAAPAKNGYQRMFAEFERLASTIKTQKDYIDVLKSLDLTDDSVETRRAQVYLRAFARDAQGLPLADEADDGDETAVADPLDSPAPEGPGSLTDAPEGEDPDSGMPPHDEAAETHAEGVSPHTGQPIIVELGALEAYDTSPRTAQALSAPELSLLKALRNGKAQPVPSEHNATAQHLQQLGLVAIQEDFYSAPSAQITMEGREALKGNRKTAQLDDGDFGMDGPGLADPPPDLTSDAPMEPGTDDAMDVIITVEDPTAPGKFLDLKVMPHVDESDLGSMSDDEFAEANALGDSDLANDGEAYEDYDVYAAEEAPEPESGAGEAQAKDDRPQKLASFKARTRIAAITRVASTILSGFKGKVHSLPEGALISVDGHTHAVLVARRAALAKSAQYGYLSLPPSTPNPPSASKP